MEADPELIVAQLVNMGFDLGQAVQALEVTQSLSFEAALDFLTSGCLPEASSQAYPPPRSSPSNPPPHSYAQASVPECITHSSTDPKPLLVDPDPEEDGDWSAGEDKDSYVQDALLDLRTGKIEEEMVELVKPDLEFVVESVKVFEVIEGTVHDVSETLGLSFGQTARWLQQYRWNSEALYEQFFKKPGAFVSSVPSASPAPSTGYCPICDRNLPASSMQSMECGHTFCRDDWAEHIETKILSNQADQIPCMQTGCKSLVVDSDFVKRAVSPALYRRFIQMAVQKIVDSHPLWKRCPAPGCNYVFKLDGSRKDVRCVCNFPFCTRCSSESHVPCTCQMMVDWVKKNKSEGESANWILVNTQLCPKCKWPIEKNGGCNHMTCMQCHHEFCWICKANWGGHGACNAYKEDPENKKREQAKESLDRYIHYFQRYEVHEKSKQLDTNLRQSAVEQMIELCANTSVSTKNIDLIAKATENLIECRRIIKYTYVFGFYHECVQRERELFEFLQAELERSTEELSGILEKRLGMDMLDEVRAKSNTAGK